MSMHVLLEVASVSERSVANHWDEPPGGNYWRTGRFCSFKTKPSKMASTCLR